MFEGFGKFQNDNGDVYIGEFRQDKKMERVNSCVKMMIKLQKGIGLMMSSKIELKNHDIINILLRFLKRTNLYFVF